MARDCYVYLLTNKSGTLYTGVTNNLPARVEQHKRAGIDTFTGRYKLTRLIYYESTPDISVAIQREKQIKGWTHQKKLPLIASFNPKWSDLGEGWYEDRQAGVLGDRLDSPAEASE